MGNQPNTPQVKKINPTEFQTYIMVVQAKLTQNRNKKVELIKRKRKEIASCLTDNNIDIAKAKMESLLREEDYITIFDILGPLCEILKEKVTYMLMSDKCPDDLRASLDTLVFASTRLEIDEMHKIRELVRSKYGELYITKANTNADSLVNVNVVEKMKVKPASDQYLIARIKQLCREEKIEFEFPQEIVPMIQSFEPFNNFDNQFSGGNQGEQGGNFSQFNNYPNPDNYHNPNPNNYPNPNPNNYSNPNPNNYPNPNINSNLNQNQNQNQYQNQNHSQNQYQSQNFPMNYNNIQMDNNLPMSNINMNNLSQMSNIQSNQQNQTGGFNYKDPGFNYSQQNVNQVDYNNNNNNGNNLSTNQSQMGNKSQIDQNKFNPNRTQPRDNNYNPSQQYSNSDHNINYNISNSSNVPKENSSPGQQFSSFSSDNNQNRFPSQSIVMDSNYDKSGNNPKLFDSSPMSTKKPLDKIEEAGSSYIDNSPRISKSKLNENMTPSNNSEMGKNTSFPQRDQSQYNIIKNDSYNPYQNDFNNNGSMKQTSSVNNKLYSNEGNATPKPSDQDDLTFPKVIGSVINQGNAGSVEDLFPRPSNDEFPRPKK